MLGARQWADTHCRLSRRRRGLASAARRTPRTPGVHAPSILSGPPSPCPPQRQFARESRRCPLPFGSNFRRGRTRSLRSRRIRRRDAAQSCFVRGRSFVSPMSTTGRSLVARSAFIAILALPPASGWTTISVLVERLLDDFDMGRRSLLFSSVRSRAKRCGHPPIGNRHRYDVIPPLERWAGRGYSQTFDDATGVNREQRPQEWSVFPSAALRMPDGCP